MRRLTMISAGALAVATLSSCGSTLGPPDMVGTWTGTYSFAHSDGRIEQSTETIVITRQDGSHIWGYEQWQDNGAPQRADVQGSIGADNRSIALTEKEGFFIGTVYGGTATLRYVRTGDHDTTFEVTVTRQ